MKRFTMAILFVGLGCAEAEPPPLNPSVPGYGKAIDPYVDLPPGTPQPADDPAALTEQGYGKAIDPYAKPRK